MVKQSDFALALQGGGAHGAFTWGVLDRLLAEGIGFDRVCGVSSGALNAVMLVQGWVSDGPRGARAALRRLWERMAEAHSSGFRLFTGVWPGLGTTLRLLNPAVLGPISSAPLRQIIAELLDPPALADRTAPRVFVGATDVETGTAEVWDNCRITPETLFASCCLPMLFPPAEIEGRTYWDGGYSGNPPLAPLLAPTLPGRIALVRAQPRLRHGTPRRLEEVANRLAELHFDGVLQAEVAALPDDIKLIVYGDDDGLAELPLASKLNGNMSLFDHLFHLGCAAVERAGETVLAPAA